MSLLQRGIPPEDFYGGRSASQDKIEDILKNEQNTPLFKKPKFSSRLLGPSTTWQVFKKQLDAIEFCLRRRNGLLSFAFEDINGRRMFLVAHPKVFWEHNSDRFFKNCNTYEIIREFAACKLYLDIEFEHEFNKSCVGSRMLINFLKIINQNLYDLYNIKVDISDILDLDSSSDIKFSHHIIYEIKGTAFQDNYAVGNFIKKVCCELKDGYENSLSGNDSKLTVIAKKYALSSQEILELFVYDNKGKTKIFTDEGVYTKNRHFRMLGSSKQAKNIPLVISKTNKYQSQPSKDSFDCCLFLDSLVTYFTWKVDRVLECNDSENTKKNMRVVPNRSSAKTQEESENKIYPEIDAFIKQFISPNGWIRRKVYFCDKSLIVYDIQGYRYCDNIKREHKSNNIKYIVDLSVLGFYQKCYDPDCGDFRSELKPFPEKIRFLFEDDSFLVNEGSLDKICESGDELCLEAVNTIEGDCCFEQSISDEDLLKVVDCTEAMVNINW